MPPRSSGCTSSISPHLLPDVDPHSSRLGRTDRAVLAVNGFAADGNMFVKKVKQRLEVRFPTLFTFSPQETNVLTFQWYRHAHAKDMPLRAIARLIQTMLYAKRFFPYYVYNILGGIEEDGSPRPSPYPNSLVLTQSVRNRRCILFRSRWVL